jgi:hypothetical protein
MQSALHDHPLGRRFCRSGSLRVRPDARLALVLDDDHDALVAVVRGADASPEVRPRWNVMWPGIVTTPVASS